MPTVLELREKAKAIGIKGYYRMRKDELYAALGSSKRRITFKTRTTTCPEIREMPSESEVIRSFNCLELPLKDVRFILGPCTFYQFKIGTRNLYLFGEFHLPLDRSADLLSKNSAHKFDTLTFPSFIHSLAVQNPTKTYDLMFESPYFLNKGFVGGQKIKSCLDSPTVNAITRQFSDCIHFERRAKCPYKNLRTHYVDYRRTMEDMRIYRRNIKDIQSMEVSQIGKEIERILVSDRVQKQISAINDEEIRESLVRFFKELVVRDPSRAAKAQSAVMDVYAMARVLRDFDPLIASAESHAFPGTSQNVIYYAGNHHINIFVSFLTEYLGLQPEYSYSSLPECNSFIQIDMSKTSLI